MSKIRTKQYNKGYRHDIINLLLSVGVLTTDAMHLWFKDNYISAVKMTEVMIKEGIIRKGKIKTPKKMIKYYTLTDFDNRYKEYMRFFSPGRYKIYNSYLKDEVDRIHWRTSEEYRKERITRSSDTGVLFIKAGIIDDPSEKRDILNKDEGIIDEPRYLSMREIKKTDDIVSGSRAVGIFFTTQETFVVYNAGNRRPKWSMRAEGRISEMTGWLDKIYRDSSYIRQKKSKALLIGDDSIIQKIFEENKTQKGDTLLTIPSGYDELYFLPYTENGTELLHMIGEQEWARTLKDKYLSKYQPPNKTNGIAHDAKDGKTYILLFCIPDLEKLYNFIKRARFIGEREKFRILCYDWQKPVLETIAGKECIIEIVKEETRNNTEEIEVV